MELKIYSLDEEPIIISKRSPEERFVLRYTWAEICFNPEAAKNANHKSSDFERGLSWYASFRWFLGKKNFFLDKLLDVEHITVKDVSKKEYELNCRVWMKWIRKYGW